LLAGLSLLIQGNCSNGKKSYFMSKQILSEKNILLNCKTESKFAAIERVGNVLVSEGYVTPKYLEGMKAREKKFTTYIGNGIAIPHGVNEYKKEIIESGIVIAQYPKGVDFGSNNTAFLVIGIAGKGQEHLDILTKIALSVQDEHNVKRLTTANDPKEIISIIDEAMM